MRKKDYEDMLDMPRPSSDLHPKMNRTSRAAQFAPFAALTGFEELVKEEERSIETKIFLSEDEKLRINNMILNAINSEDPYEISVKFFVEDERKNGGAYFTRVGVPIKIDEYERVLFMADGTKIDLDGIVSAEK